MNPFSIINLSVPNNSTIKNLQSIGSMPMNHIWGPLIRDEGPYMYI